MAEDGSPVIPESDRAAEELSSREAELRREIEREKHEKAVLEERHQFENLERLKVKDELQEYMAGDKEIISELRSKNGELESRISRLEEGIGGRLRKERRLGERRSQRLANIEAGIRERETEDVEEEEDEVEFDGSGSTVSGGDSSPPRPARRGRGRPRKMSGNKKEMKKTRKDETEDAEEDCDGSGSSGSEGDSSPHPPPPPPPPPRRGRGRPRTKRNANLQMSVTIDRYELLNTFESQEKCAGLEVKVESAAREKERAEQRCKEIEEKHAFEVSEKAKIQKDHAFLWENYQLERKEKLRVEERCNVMGQKVEVEVSERQRVEEKFAELEERHELEKLERLNVEHELKVLDEKHELVVEELRRFEKKCGELEERSEILMLEKLNAEDECRGLEEKKRLEVEEKRKVEKEYAELWEKHKSELLEKVKVGIMYKELKEKHRKVEEEYEKLDEAHNFDMLERIKMEKECKEVAEKYRIEVMEKRKVEEKYDALVEKYRDVMMEILKEHGEIHERHRFEQQEKLKLKRECEELKEKIKLLRRAQESEKGEENVMFDKKYGVLQEKYEFERLENLKMRNEFKELMEFHRLELLAKIKAENDLKECQAQLEGLQEEVIVASERYDKLLEEVRKGRKAEDKELVFECQNNNVDSQNRMCKETFELQASGSGKWMNAKSLDSRNKEKRSENGGIADERSDKNPRESSDHVIDLEDIPNSLPASEVSPRNGGLRTTDALKFSSGCSIIISDSDDDCAPGGKKQMGHKRKRDSSPNDNLEKDASSIKTAEMKQRKLGRCDSLVNYFSETVAPSAASDYGKQIKSSSHTHIISGAIEIVRGTQKSCVESPAMASKTPFDCESDDDSTSISSSDDSVDVDELQSMLSAAVEMAKA